VLRECLPDIAIMLAAGTKQQFGGADRDPISARDQPKLNKNTTKYCQGIVFVGFL